MRRKKELERQKREKEMGGRDSRGIKIRRKGDRKNKRAGEKWGDEVGKKSWRSKRKMGREGRQ